MSRNVYWMLELAVLPGREDDLESLKAEMIRTTLEQEPGVLNYEWSLSADRRVCHIYERYADASAVLTHLESFNTRFAERFLAALKPLRFVVYGAPDAAVRDALTGLGPVYMNDSGGFARQS